MSSRVATTLRTNTSGCPARRCETVSSRVDSSSSGTQKPLISREIFRIRPRSTRVLGICGQGSSSETALAMLNRQPTLSSRQNPAFFVRCLSSSEGLRLRIWSRPPSISTQATCGTCSRGLACCSGKGNSAQAFVWASRCCHALLADPLGRPHDPLVGNVQLRFFFQVLAGLLKAAGMTARVDHLAKHSRTHRVIRRDSQGLGLREKKPSGIACIVRRILARRPLRVWPGEAGRRSPPRGLAPRNRCTCLPYDLPLSACSRKPCDEHHTGQRITDLAVCSSISTNFVPHGG